MKVLRLHDEPEPESGPGEVLVRVAAVGLCGSDLHWLSAGSGWRWTRQWPVARAPSAGKAIRTIGPATPWVP